jgi:hypothetical protein
MYAFYDVFLMLQDYKKKAQTLAGCASIIAWLSSEKAGNARF